MRQKKNNNWRKELKIISIVIHTHTRSYIIPWYGKLKQKKTWHALSHSIVFFFSKQTYTILIRHSRIHTWSLNIYPKKKNTWRTKHIHRENTYECKSYDLNGIGFMENCGASTKSKKEKETQPKKEHILWEIYTKMCGEKSSMAPIRLLAIEHNIMFLIFHSTFHENRIREFYFATIHFLPFCQKKNQQQIWEHNPQEFHSYS